MRRDFTRRLYARIGALSDISPTARASVGVCVPVIGDAVMAYLDKRPSAMPASPADVRNWAPMYRQLFVEVMLNESTPIEDITARLPIIHRLRGWGVVLLSEHMAIGTMSQRLTISSLDNRSQANLRRVAALHAYLHALSPALDTAVERRDAAGIESALADVPVEQLAKARRGVAETGRLLGLTSPNAVREQQEAIRLGTSPRWETHATLWLDRTNGTLAPAWEWAFGVHYDRSGKFHGSLMAPTATADNVRDEDAMLLLALAGFSLSLGTRKAGRSGTEGSRYYQVPSRWHNPHDW